MTEEQKTKIDFTIKILILVLSGFSTSFLSGMIMSGIWIEPWTAGYIIIYLFFAPLLFQGLTLFFSFVFGKFNWCYTYQVKVFQKLEAFIKKRKSLFKGNSDNSI